MTSLQQEVRASWLKFVRRFVVLYLPVFFVVLQRLQERGGGGKIVLIVVEAVPASSKPPVVDGSMHTSTSERCKFGASAP